MSDNSNGHIVLSGMKGIWTLEEVVDLLHQHGLKVKISMASKGDYRESDGLESPNLYLKEV